MDNLKLLHLNLKSDYFDQIKNGQKKWEYRLYNNYWMNRLIHKKYDGILIKKGYPKKDDSSRIIKRVWRGWKIKEIRHPHFGNMVVKVFAIRVNP